MSAAITAAAVVAVGAYAASENAKSGAKDAAKDAADSSAASARDATQLQGKIYDQNRSDQMPWRTAGESALNQLSNLMGTGAGFDTGKTKDQLVTDSNFNGAAYLAANPDVASNAYYNQNPLAHFQQYGRNEQRHELSPLDKTDSRYGSLARDFTMADYQADPGYAFRLAEGQKALERSAAARGGLYSGRAMKDMNAYSQGQASQEYGNAYNRFQSNQTNEYNRLASLAGLGQTANNALAQSGMNYANQTGNIAMTNGANQGNAAIASGNATASGYAGIGNALGKVNWGSFGGSSTPSGSSWGQGVDGAYNQTANFDTYGTGYSP